MFAMNGGVNTEFGHRNGAPCRFERGWPHTLKLDSTEADQWTIEVRVDLFVHALFLRGTQHAEGEFAKTIVRAAA